MATPAKSGQDLIADRAGIGRCRIDAVVVVQEIDEAARSRKRRVGVRDVENDEIHRNSTEKRKPFTAEAARAAIAQRAEPTVRIADRDGCKAARTVHDVRGTVAN
jgi:hypothetical protein